MSPELLVAAADEVGLTELPARAAAIADLSQEVTAEFTAGRDTSVFGVPTLEVEGAPPIYGPILPTAARDVEALEWWTHIRWLAQRTDFFELKRWPRTSRPGAHG